MFDDKIEAVISDYNWLEEKTSESWVGRNFTSYQIFDKYHRDVWAQNINVVNQLNVGQNIYDMLDYLVTHYETIPPRIFFARGCLLFPKGRQKPLSNGNCAEENLWDKFTIDELVVEVHDFSCDDVDGLFSKIDGHAYFEKLGSWWFRFHPGRYYFCMKTFLNELYQDEYNKEYVRFSPGASYIIKREAVRQYPIELYLNLRYLVAWGCIVGEAHMLERTLYELLESKKNITPLYLLSSEMFKKKMRSRRNKTFLWNLLIRPLYLFKSKFLRSFQN